MEVKSNLYSGAISILKIHYGYHLKDFHGEEKWKEMERRLPWRREMEKKTSMEKRNGKTMERGLSWTFLLGNYHNQ